MSARQRVGLTQVCSHFLVHPIILMLVLFSFSVPRAPMLLSKLSSCLVVNHVINESFYSTDEIKNLLDPAFIEHDSYAMFEQIMETIEPWYSQDMVSFKVSVT